MTWPAVFSAFLVCHLVGDFLLQTDWQARHKARGLGRDPLARRALLAHVTSYTVAFLPALVWIAREADAGRAIVIGAAVALPHLALDDGRGVGAWLRIVKRCREPYPPAVRLSVDQSLHIACLLGAALLAVAG
jgi:hypothetical protein